MAQDVPTGAGTGSQVEERGRQVKKHKLKLTRPDFLLELMGGDPDNLSTGSMRLCMSDTTPLCYCVYTVLMEADIDPDDVLTMNNDGESIGIKFKSKSLAKETRDKCNEEIVSYGANDYEVRVKHRGQFLICSIEKQKSDEDDED